MSGYFVTILFMQKYGVLKKLSFPCISFASRIEINSKLFCLLSYRSIQLQTKIDFHKENLRLQKQKRRTM